MVSTEDAANLDKSTDEMVEVRGSELTVRVDDKESVLVTIRLLEEVMSADEAETAAEKAELCITVDTIVPSKLEDGTVSDVVIGAWSDEVGDCAEADSEAVRSAFGEVVVERVLMVGVSEIAMVPTEAVFNPARIELDTTELSGVMAKSPIDRPASVWRLNLRRGIATRGQLTTRLNAGDVSLDDT